MGLEGVLKGLDELFKLIQGQAGQIQELSGTRLHLGELDTRHGMRLLLGDYTLHEFESANILRLSDMPIWVATALEDVADERVKARAAAMFAHLHAHTRTTRMNFPPEAHHIINRNKLNGLQYRSVRNEAVEQPVSTRLGEILCTAAARAMRRIPRP
jgi:hypothetical protein